MSATSEKKTKPPVPSDGAGTRRLALIDVPGFVPYARGLEMQDDLVARRRDGQAGDTLLLLEHEPVYTIGRTRERSSLGAVPTLPHPVHEISRGGQATYHGPGQLTGYPIVDLTRCGRDLHRYLRILEQALIDTCACFDVEAGRREGMTGVWVGDRKLASIGVGVRRWISLHGFAINLTPESLTGFQAITPCGISGVKMTCLTAETAQPIDRPRFTEALVPALERALYG